MDYVALGLACLSLYGIADTLLGLYNADFNGDRSELFCIGPISRSGKNWTPRYDDC